MPVTRARLAKTLVLLCHVLMSDMAWTDLSSKDLVYLQRYGYLVPPAPGSGALKSRDDLVEAVKALQRFAGIPVTGYVDDATREMMQRARCGMPDIVSKEATSRLRRYALQGGRWDKKFLTYRIVNYTPDLTRDQVRSTIRRAFDKWAAVSTLRFYEVKSDQADIMIKFDRLQHNDPFPFDGPGGTLAHAFYPQSSHGLAGDTHFDEDETFTLNSDVGKNFLWLAVHEFGHALGLEHSDQKGTIMFPWYEGFSGVDIELSRDDENGIQALYGRPVQPDGRPVQPDGWPVQPDGRPRIPPVTVDRPVCLDNVRAIFAGAEKDTVVVNGDKVYLFDENLVFKKGPVLLSTYFPGLVGLDTAYVRKDGRVAFFHGDRYWIYDRQQRLSEPRKVYWYGLRLTDMYNFDAAFRWSLNDKVYFFKGSRYWRYDEHTQRVDVGYPKLISESWVGVPNFIDAAFEWTNKKVYFFKGGLYYRFDERRFEVSKRYPMPIRNNFLVCDRDQAGSNLGDDGPTPSATASAAPVLTWRWTVVMVTCLTHISLFLF